MEFDISKVLTSHNGTPGTLLISCKVDNVAELARICAALSKDDTRVEVKPIPKKEDEERPISLSEALEFTGLTRQGLYNARRRGEIETFKLGGKLYFFKSQLLAALKKC